MSTEATQRQCLPFTMRIRLDTTINAALPPPVSEFGRPLFPPANKRANESKTLLVLFYCFVYVYLTRM